MCLPALRRNKINKLCFKHVLLKNTVNQIHGKDESNNSTKATCRRLVCASSKIEFVLFNLRK